jgi:hypothetical protein
MAITAGHYNLVLKGHFASGDQVVNSFYVNQAVDGAYPIGFEDELFSIGKKFWDTIKASLMAVTSELVAYDLIEVFKADGSDVGNSGFYTIPVGDNTGRPTGDCLPPFAAWSFQYTRPNANFRHGWKRFAGVPESLQLDGRATDAAVALLATLATALKTPIQMGIAAGVNMMTPALVQRVKGGQPIDPDIWYTPSTVVYKKIGHQTTRDYGRGS